MKNKYNKPYIIAETACAHDGSLMKLIKMIDFVGNSNAQSIQFRVFSHKNTITKNHPDFKKIKKLVLTKDEWIKCFNYTKKKYPNLEIISSIPSSDELIFSDKLGADAFKLHSADLDNYELLEACIPVSEDKLYKFDDDLKYALMQSTDSIIDIYRLQIANTNGDTIKVLRFDINTSYTGNWVGIQFRIKLFTKPGDSTSEIKDFSKNEGLISSFSDSEKKLFSYRIVFKNRKQLSDFRDKYIGDKRILNIKSDLQS